MFSPRRHEVHIPVDQTTTLRDTGKRFFAVVDDFGSLVFLLPLKQFQEASRYTISASHTYQRG